MARSGLFPSSRQHGPWVRAGLRCKNACLLRFEFDLCSALQSTVRLCGVAVDQSIEATPHLVDRFERARQIDEFAFENSRCLQRSIETLQMQPEGLRELDDLLL